MRAGRITHEQPYTPPAHAWAAHEEALHGNGEALDRGVARAAESALGFDFGRVRIHRDAAANVAAQAMSAHAYTWGEHIFLRSGTIDGGLLRHELSHVAEQAGSPPEVMRAPASAPPPATYLICYGSGRLNPGTPYEHNVGDLFKFAAEAKKREIVARLGKSAAQNNIVLAYTPTEIELIAAVNRKHPLPVKELHVYSHGWEQGINLGGQDPGWGKKGTETDLDMEQRKVRPGEAGDYKVDWADDPSVYLYGCNIGNPKDGAPMAQSVANAWGVPVKAPSVASHFEQGGFGQQQVPDKGGKTLEYKPTAASVDERLTAVEEIVKRMESRRITKKRGLVAQIRGSQGMYQLRATIDPHLEWLTRVLADKRIEIPGRDAKLAKLAALVNRADALAAQ